MGHIVWSSDLFSSHPQQAGQVDSSDLASS